SELHERIFQRLFSIAKVAQLPPEERQVYEHSLKDYRDFMSAQDTAHLEGYQEGMEEGKQLGLEEGKQLGLEEGLEKGKQLGVEEGKQLGLEEGALRKAQAIAQNLLQLGSLSIEQIAEIAGLSVEAVLKLRD
ncbi:MAG: Yae1 family protein, partial [Thiolinea sp.]